MYHRDHWAAVFVNSLGENAGAGLDCLKALVPPLQTIPGAVSGYSASRQLENILRKSIALAEGASGEAAEYAIRFITLLVQKNHFGDIDPILHKIEDLIDIQKGTLVVTAECASPMDGVIAEELRQHIIEKTGAAQVKMKTRLVPQLLGGYRLRIGGYYVDASLKGQTERMKAALEQAVTASPAGGI